MKAGVGIERKTVKAGAGFLEKGGRMTQEPRDNCDKHLEGMIQTKLTSKEKTVRKWQ